MALRNRQGALMVLLASLVLASSAAQARAQSSLSEAILSPRGDHASLLVFADRISSDPGTGLTITRGNVQLVSGDRLFETEKLLYDERAGHISAPEGGRFVDGEGNIIIATRSVRFDEAFAEAHLQGVHLLSVDDARFAAHAMRRIGGTRNIFTRGVYSPCAICADSPTPLWRIRAKRIIHDETLHDVQYENAVLEYYGLPVAFLPYFKHADGTILRRSGFLPPEYQISSTLGYSIAMPYFLNLAANRDLTVTPHWDSEEKDGRLEIEYRALLESGSYRIGGSATNTDFARDGRMHGHLLAHGDFDLGHDFRLFLDANYATEIGYLKRYGISDADRLKNVARLSRFHPEGFEQAELLLFQSLREEEQSHDIPASLANVKMRRSLRERFGLSSDLWLNLAAGILATRTDQHNGSLSAMLEWGWSGISDFGLEVSQSASTRADLYLIGDGPGGEEATVPALVSSLRFDMRYPIVREDSFVTQRIDPYIQPVIMLNSVNENALPSDGSLLILHDNRWGGLDLWADGFAVTAGAQYSAAFRAGPLFNANIQRIMRVQEDNARFEQFDYSHEYPDILGKYDFTWPGRFRFRHQVSMDDSLAVTLEEIGLSAYAPLLSASATYLRSRPGPHRNALEDREELKTSLEVKVSPFLTLSGSVIRNLEDGAFVESGAGLRYEDECIRVQLSYERDYTSSPNAPDNVIYKLTIRLFGI